MEKMEHVKNNMSERFVPIREFLVCCFPEHFPPVACSPCSPWANIAISVNYWKVDESIPLSWTNVFFFDIIPKSTPWWVWSSRPRLGMAQFRLRFVTLQSFAAWGLLGLWCDHEVELRTAGSWPCMTLSMVSFWTCASCINQARDLQTFREHNQYFAFVALWSWGKGYVFATTNLRFQWLWVLYLQPAVEHRAQRALVASHLHVSWMPLDRLLVTFQGSLSIQ